MTPLGLIAVGLLVSIAFGLLLALFVWNEHEREELSREAAERRARRDTDETEGHTNGETGWK